ncbi:MAG: histidinol dehydrogenase, partial [Deltaproteobacteria bacterium]|nr:histidinol dehydrogenase [Deltaproteobacteria bacterium]
MSLRLFLPSDDGYQDALDNLTHRASVIPQEVDERARAIISDVRARGDAAVREYTER